MAGDGIFVRGRNGNFQIDSQFLQPIIIEEGTMSGGFVQYADTTVNHTYDEFYGGWNTGSYYSPGLSDITLPSGYGANDVLIFAKPRLSGTTYKLAMRWIGNTTFQFFAPDQHSSWENDSCTVDYVICSVLPEDAPAPHQSGSGEYGLEVRNDFGDVMYRSTRKTFLGEGVLSGRPRIRRYGDHSSGNVYAIEGLGMLRTEDLESRISYQTANRALEANQDLYAMMNSTSSIVSRQSWGNILHPRGAKCQTHEYWCFISFYFKEIQDMNQDLDSIPEQEIEMVIEERILMSSGPNYPMFEDHESLRTLLIGRFQ
jgi:hypothetical protein